MFAKWVKNTFNRCLLGTGRLRCAKMVVGSDEIRDIDIEIQLGNTPNINSTPMALRHLGAVK
jgi:hypothetical protein